MIVNPQLFNYRLIISSLLVVLTVLGIYSYTNYKSITSYEEFLKQEKSLIEDELSEMLTDYDDLSQDYNLVASELKEARLETKAALDSLRLLKGDLSIIKKYKNQLIVLKSKSRVLLSTIDSLNNVNQKLQKEKRYALETIGNKTKAIANLKEANDALNKTIDKAAILKASEVSAEAYRIRSNKKRSTSRAKRADGINVCLTLLENPLTEKGEKNIYVQIVNPQGNVLADKDEIIFGNSSLIFSQKKVVSYQNNNLNVCASILADNEDQPLTKGYYFINVFHEDVKLGGTSIFLK